MLRLFVQFFAAKPVVTFEQEVHNTTDEQKHFCHQWIISNSLFHNNTSHSFCNHKQTSIRVVKHRLWPSQVGYDGKKDYKNWLFEDLKHYNNLTKTTSAKKTPTKKLLLNLRKQWLREQTMAYLNDTSSL